MRHVIVLFLALILLLCANPATAGSFDPHKATAYMDVQFECELVMDSHPTDGDGAPVALQHPGDDFPAVVAVYTNYSGYGEGFTRRLTNKIIEDMRNDGAFK
jgi:hypothetical protein